MLASRTQIDRLTKKIVFHDSELTRYRVELNKILASRTPVFKDWKTNSVFCITSANKFCKSVDILDCLAVSNKCLRDLSERNKNISALSIALKRMADANKIVRIRRQGMKGDLYGLPSWIDDQGNPKPEYLDEKIKHLV